MMGDESPMDVDDVSSLSTLSSADAEGDEDDEDVSFVNDMLVCFPFSRSLQASHCALRSMRSQAQNRQKQYHPTIKR